MTDNSEFRSDAGEWFWVTEDHAKKKIIADTIIRDCKRSNSTAYVMIIFMAFAFIYGIYTAVTDFRNNILFSVLAVTVAPIGFYMFVSALLAMRRYIEKAEEGRLKFRHVIIKDRRFSANMTANKFEVYMESQDDGPEASAVVEVEKTLYEKTAVGLTGWFAVIDGERKKFLVSPYWFIPDTDPKASVSPITPVTASAGTAPSEEAAGHLTASYRKANSNTISSSLTAALLFFIGGVITGLGILISDNKAAAALGIMMSFAAVIIMSVLCITDTFKGRRNMLLMWAVWLQPNVFGQVFLISPNLQLPVKTVLLAVLFLINMGMVYYVNINRIRTYRDLKAGNCLVKPATVRSINRRNRITPPFYITISTCIAADDEGTTYEAEITPSQARKLKEETRGSLVFLSGKDSQILFF